MAAFPTAAPVDPLTPSQLVGFTRFVADEVRRGLYPFVRYDPAERWHQRIYRDRRVDIWLISWLPTQGAQLHDHGGSSGAFTVLDGELAEAVYVASGRGAGGLRERTVRRGRSIGFDHRHVHDVRNVSDQPAVSVHAYSRPLTTMTYYDLVDGRLVALTSLATVDPEPVLDLDGWR
jgi:hypothetical protein